MIVFADDADFICRDPAIVAKIEADAPAILARWSLVMNTSKTEHTTVVGPYTPQRIALTALKKKPGETLANLTLSWGTWKTSPDERT
ncbi:hypothetical protein PC129_g21327 [Phytophthora cactorum]|uniref:Uncharacterized protein n=1 Tax=Phytophthora cactorum TaxID=29920 RepID=A0A329RCR2_9STRA|nr:hypothetical protein Pcac1_g17933 [Phytophthora cactorum]KAG2841511.1 hypothetical protein PC112_g3378 [Phytophthora cactorum]KAG2842407.1 hypothetical protein PC111_g2770 [Phytophthora cactorum]KAG2865603.1 hypothetical protein PC113_g3597 [Phytophthora cactorum]KAG2925397.1 hypothetical protein PC114_g4167 [Phytophthora cactorum]